MGTWTPERLDITPEARRRIAEVWVRYVQDNSRLRVNADGTPLPPGVDLYRTGYMLFTGIRITETGVEFLADYAAETNERWNWAGVPPQRLEEFLAEIGPILTEGLLLT